MTNSAKVQEPNPPKELETMVEEVAAELQTIFAENPWLSDLIEEISDIQESLYELERESSKLELDMEELIFRDNIRDLRQRHRDLISRTSKVDRVINNPTKAPEIDRIEAENIEIEDTLGFAKLEMYHDVFSEQRDEITELLERVDRRIARKVDTANMRLSIYISTLAIVISTVSLVAP